MVIFVRLPRANRSPENHRNKSVDARRLITSQFTGGKNRQDGEGITETPQGRSYHLHHRQSPTAVRHYDVANHLNN